MRRREFIAGLGVAAWPLAARAQQREVRRVGVLMGVAEDDPEARVWAMALRRGLQEAGWIEGRNVQIDFRWSSGDVALMSIQAAELVALQPDVIVSHATPATKAVRQQTLMIPNVFVVVGDPIGSGLIESIPRPGGNSTGFTNFELMFGTKWFELLKDIKPELGRIALLFNPSTFFGSYAKQIRDAAASVGVSTVDIPFRTTGDIEAAFGKFEHDLSAGVIVFPDTSTTFRSKVIVEMAARYRLPVIYPYRTFVDLGGLLSYGVDRADLFRRAATYAHRILRGEKPADLPVIQPTKFELVINLRTAKALGLTIPETLLATADEVIQ